MKRLTLHFDGPSPNLELTVKLRATPTAVAVLAAAPFTATTQTWGDEVYFDAPVSAAPESDATDVVTAGEIAFWLAGSCIAIGYGPTPVSQADEIRLASPCNIWADAEGDVKTLAAVRPGTEVRVTEAAD